MGEGEARRKGVDVPVLTVLLACVVVRAALLMVWPNLPAIRDEASYLLLARKLAQGEGVQPAPFGWLWAPLYPWFLSIHLWLLGSAELARWTQVGLSALGCALVFRLGGRLGGRQAGLAAAWLYALEPTLVGFSTYLWSEHVYSVLLLATTELLLWARERAGPWSAAPGATLGLCALSRGVAVYALPFALPALLMGRLRDPGAWRRVGFLVLGAILVIAPYSTYASRKFHGFVLSDAVLGRVLWLGNNDFDPISFDYRMGADSGAEYRALIATGRPECAEELGVLERNRCEIHNALAFIQARPLLFVRRIWTREAQTFNPNSFLVRSVRLGVYPGMPAGFRDATCALVVLAHFAVLVTAALGLFAAPRSPLKATVVGFSCLHLAAVGATVGMSRYRVPLVPLWIAFSGFFVVSPRALLRDLFGAPRRAVGAAALILAFLALSLQYVDRGLR